MWVGCGKKKEIFRVGSPCFKTEKNHVRNDFFMYYLLCSWMNVSKRTFFFGIYFTKYKNYFILKMMVSHSLNWYTEIMVGRFIFKFKIFNCKYRGIEILVAKCVTFGYFISRYSNYTDPFIYPRAAHNLEFHACVNIWVSVYTRENIIVC